MLKIIEKLKNKNKIIIFVFLFLTLLLMRSHTLFNDYYDIDFQSSLVEAYYSIENNLGFKPAIFSYGKAAFIFYYYPQKIFGKYNWRSIHIIGIFLIFLTAIAIFYSVKCIYNDRAALISSFFYVLFINIMNKDFLSFSAEIIFNFYLSYAFLFLILFEFSKSKNKFSRFFYLSLSLLFAVLGSMTKFPAVFFLFIYPIYFIFIQIKQRKRIILISITVVLLGLFVLIFDIFFLNKFILNKVIFLYKAYSQYVLAYDLSISSIFLRLLWTVFLLFCIQFIIWFLCLKFIFSSKLKNTSSRKKLILIFFICSLFPALITLRFYPHYFIQAFLPATICAGIYLDKFLSSDKFTAKRGKIINAGIIVPAIILLIFYFTFLTIKIIKPNFKTNANMFFPNKKFVPAVKWLKKNLNKGDKIYVWGVGIEIYYFTKSSTIGVHLWPRPLANMYFSNIKKPSKYAVYMMKHLILKLEINKAKYIIDLQPINYGGFGKYPISKVAILHNYIKNKYKFVHNAGGVKIYKRKKGK